MKTSLVINKLNCIHALFNSVEYHRKSRLIMLKLTVKFYLKILSSNSYIFLIKDLDLLVKISYNGKKAKGCS